jgi:hypothetical protein
MLVSAESFDRALEVARECPGVIMPGSSVEMRHRDRVQTVGLLHPDQDTVAVGSRFIKDRTRSVPAEVCGGHAESIEIDSRVSHGILQCRPFECDEPERYVGLDEPLLLHLIHENAKPLDVTCPFAERAGPPHNTTRRLYREHRFG